jgi:hypothetical protein
MFLQRNYLNSGHFNIQKNFHFFPLNSIHFNLKFLIPKKIIKYFNFRK